MIGSISHLNLQISWIVAILDTLSTIRAHASGPIFNVDQ